MSENKNKPSAEDSLDPRVNRAGLLHPEGEYQPEERLDQWETYEVFHQAERGAQHVHTGIVHAPNAEMAILFAKEQFARRMECVNIWVVRSADVHQTEYEDADMFLPSFDKDYREAAGYRNREKIKRFKDLADFYSANPMASAVKANASAGKKLGNTQRRTVQGEAILEKTCTLVGPSGQFAGEPPMITAKVLKK